MCINFNKSFGWFPMRSGNGGPNRRRLRAASTRSGLGHALIGPFSLDMCNDSRYDTRSPQPPPPRSPCTREWAEAGAHRPGAAPAGRHDDLHRSPGIKHRPPVARGPAVLKGIPAKSRQKCNEFIVRKAIREESFTRFGGYSARFIDAGLDDQHLIGSFELRRSLKGQERYGESEGSYIN